MSSGDRDGVVSPDDPDYWALAFYEAGAPWDKIPPMVICWVSVVCSYVMIRESYRDILDKPREATLARQNISLSVAFVIYHASRMLGPLAGPKETEVWGALGSTASCTASGFFVQFGLFPTIVLHTVLIWMYYVMVIYGWRDEEKLNWYFLWMNGITWVVSLAIALPPIPLGHYNFDGYLCWLYEYPYECQSRDDFDCIRGEKVLLWRLVLSVLPAWPCAVAIVYMFCKIYAAVRQRENGMSRFDAHRYYHQSSSQHQRSHQDSSTSDGLQAPRTEVSPRASSGTSNGGIPSTAIDRRRSNAVAKQAMLYIVGLFTILVIYTILLLLYAASGTFPRGLRLAANSLLSSFGWVNALIFVRPRKEKMKTAEGRLLRRILWSFCFERVAGACSRQSGDSLPRTGLTQSQNTTSSRANSNVPIDHQRQQDKPQEPPPAGVE